jgi:CO/xanthine dehydrogenase FAD-binding subunit
VKPAPFAYVAARSVEEALAEVREGAWVLAGGQSLVPLLNARDLRPGRLVDINGAGLGLIRRSGGVLELGATVRQAALERSRIVREHWPLLAQAVRYVGHPATRARGTVGGSVALRDPRSELPAALLALDARYRLRGGGRLLVSVEVPPLPAGTRTGFAEFVRTRGDWASAGAAVVLAPGHAAVAVLGPRRVPMAERALVAGAPAREAAEIVAEEEGGTPHQRALLADVVRRALAEAGRA